jgi:hypothetical protein
LKLLTKSKNSFSNPLLRPYSGDFDPENAYRKPPVILEMLPEAGYCVCIGKNRPIAEKGQKSSNDRERTEIDK